jgi:hypothetical protein
MKTVESAVPGRIVTTLSVRKTGLAASQTVLVEIGPSPGVQRMVVTLRREKSARLISAE